MKYAALLSLLALSAFSPLHAAAKHPRILLLGDSTMITSYLPAKDGVTGQLEAALKNAYPSQSVEVVNRARNGEWIARYLIGGAYEADYAKLQGADVIFVRFGINDHKRVSEDEYSSQLQCFIQRLKEDFPDARVILETSLYADPAHFDFDRNVILNPYWDRVRAIANKNGLPLSDIYEATRQETERGNWDLRIRHTPKGAPMVFDASQDAGRENDKVWFTNIHPNAEGVRVSINREVATLKALFPENLPAGGGKLDRPQITAADYEKALDFPSSRLTGFRKIKKPTLEDTLQ